MSPPILPLRLDEFVKVEESWFEGAFGTSERSRVPFPLPDSRTVRVHQAELFLGRFFA